VSFPLPSFHPFLFLSFSTSSLIPPVVCRFENARVGASTKGRYDRTNTPSTVTGKSKSGGKRSMSTSAASSAPADETPKQYAAPGSKKRPVAPIGGAKKKKAPARKKGKKIAETSEEEEAQSSSSPSDEGERSQTLPYEELEEPPSAEESSPIKGKGKTVKEKGDVKLLLAQKFEMDGKKDPKGYWISEKRTSCLFFLLLLLTLSPCPVDGIRAYWDGQSTLWSRTGLAYAAPADFIARTYPSPSSFFSFHRAEKTDRSLERTVQSFLAVRHSMANSSSAATASTRRAGL
jgi:hypothetical protein